MSNIDKIIQIETDDNGCLIGLSESGIVYFYNYKKKCWVVEVRSPSDFIEEG